MNRKMVFHTVGLIVLAEGGLLLLPLAVSLYCRDAGFWGLLWTILLAAAVGGGLTLFCKPKSRIIYAKEGFSIVAFAWIVMSAIGALPYVISGEIPSFVDALFEMVSGFTTTGASILTDVERMCPSLLFWRSFTHWVGGMGVLVFIMALVPNLTDRSIHIMRAEMPGPVVSKLVPKAKDTAKILYGIYIVMTLLEVALLLLGGMSLFDSLIHAFGTAGTGGFGIKADSIAGYSPYLQWVITAFMLLFAVNFNLYYLLLVHRFREAVGSRELWCFLGIVGSAAAAITVNILPLYENVSTALRHAAFQVATVISTTGYATTDFNLWPSFSKTILFVLMFFGGCAGSTAGGFKLSRVMILFQTIRRELRRMLHPRSVNIVRFEGKPVDDDTLDELSGYLAIYVMCIFIIFLLLSLEPFDFETNLSATIACFNNVGPGFGAVGPASNYAAYSDGAKLLLSFAMLMGRLEVFPLVLALTPSRWAKRK